jgi:hypothetical protein
VHLVFLIDRGAEPVGEQRRERDDGVHRRPELVGHVGEKTRLQLVGAAQMVRPLVELGVERDDAAVGVLELPVDLLELGVPHAQHVERVEQLLVLLLHLLDGTRRAVRRECVGEPAQLRRGEQLGPLRQYLLQRHGRARRCRRDGELIHQPPRTDDPAAEAGRRLVASGEHLFQMRDSRALIDDADDQQLRRHGALNGVLDPSAAAVDVRVARDFGDRRRDPRLFGGIESDKRGDVPRALPRVDDVGLLPHLYGEKRTGHDASRTTTTVTSSRCRL